LATSVGETAFTRSEALGLLRSSGADGELVGHGEAVAGVAHRIGRNAQRDHPGLDLRLIELGALLHDVGRTRTHEIDHAAVGGQLVRSARRLIVDDDFRERLARVVEVHTGTGLSEERVRELNQERGLRIPVRDYKPESLEETIVALADELTAGERELTFDALIEVKRRQFGPESEMVRRLESWRARYGKYVEESGTASAARVR